MIANRTVAVTLSALLAVTAPVLVGCGNVAEMAAEKAAGAAVGGDVNVDEGGVSVTDESGNAVSIGENVKIPDAWPSSVPLFEGGTAIMASANADGSAGAMWTTDAKPEDAAAAYDKAMLAAGFTQADTSNLGGMVMTNYTGNGLAVNVTAVGTDDGTTGVSVSITKDSSTE